MRQIPISVIKRQNDNWVAGVNCSLHYDAYGERIALKALGLENTFALNAAPDLDTLQVLVNGASIHRRDMVGNMVLD